MFAIYEYAYMCHTYVCNIRVQYMIHIHMHKYMSISKLSLYGTHICVHIYCIHICVVIYDTSIFVLIYDTNTFVPIYEYHM